MVGEHSGDLAKFQELSVRQQISVKFNVMLREFAYLAGAHTDDPVVGVKPFPSPCIQREL
jgi:hypothetical protein